MREETDGELLNTFRRILHMTLLVDDLPVMTDMGLNLRASLARGTLSTQQRPPSLDINGMVRCLNDLKPLVLMVYLLLNMQGNGHGE